MPRLTDQSAQNLKVADSYWIFPGSEPCCYMVGVGRTEGMTQRTAMLHKSDGNVVVFRSAAAARMFVRRYNPSIVTGAY